MAHDQEVRVDVLQRLAEQAMSDPAFRAVARDDLDAALKQWGYDLNSREMMLVTRFRAALEEAGIDLFLEESTDLVDLAPILDRLGDISGFKE
jgi:hypothetical protein